MPSVNKVRLGPFDRSIAAINRMLERTEDVCKEMWDATHKECQLRNAGETEGIIMCGYPERINSHRENNCRYETCPLILRLYVG